MLLYLTLFACAAVISVLVYRYDLYDREPPLVLLLAAALGAGGMWLAGVVQVELMSHLGALAAAHWDATLASLAGVSEELAKLAAVILIAVVARRWFNDPIDGLIYGAFAGLGAAIEESVALLWAVNPPALPAAELVRLLGHLIMGGIGGFGVAHAWLRRPRWAAVLAGGWGLAVLLHIAWDLVAFDAARIGRMTPSHIAAAMATMLTGFIAFAIMVRRGSRASRARFVPAPMHAAARWTVSLPD